jgi:type I restriction enzyme S subunit
MTLRDVVARFYGGVSVNAEDRPCADGEHGILKLSAVNGVGFLPAEHKAVTVKGSTLGSMVRKNWVLITRSNTSDLVGAVAHVEKDYPHLHLPDLIWGIEAKPDVEPRWLALALQTGPARREIVARAAGTSGSMKKLSRQRLWSLPLLVPRLPEQHGIANIVGLYDGALRALRALIDDKRRFKRGLMQELLTGKLRFKEFGQARWSERRLGELFTERVERGRADLPLLSITGDRGVIPRDQLVRRDTSSDDKSAYLRIAPGDIGYNTMRMWQGVSALSDLEGLVSPAYTICVPGPEVFGAFAAQLFKLPRVVDAFRRHSQGLVDDTLNLKFHHFALVRIRMPAMAEQRKIAAALNALDREIGLLSRLGGALDQQRAGVAELLLTGKVRVPEAVS